MEKVQIAPRVYKPKRQILKQIAAKRGIYLNELINEYLDAGIKKDIKKLG